MSKMNPLKTRELKRLAKLNRDMTTKTNYRKACLEPILLQGAMKQEFEDFWKPLLVRFDVNIRHVTTPFEVLMSPLDKARILEGRPIWINIDGINTAYSIQQNKANRQPTRIIEQSCTNLGRHSFRGVDPTV